MREFVLFRRAADRLDINDFGGFQNRNPSVVALVRAAFQLHRAAIPGGDWAFAVYTGDDVGRVAQVARTLGFPVFAFARSTHAPDIPSFPCFAFDAWAEAGIRSFGDTAQAVLMASARPVQSRRCFWIGNIATHPLRQALYHAAQAHPDLIDFRPMSWGQPGVDGRLAADQYVSLPDHCAHALLLDVRGSGYSGRRKFLLHSGRPVLVIDGEFSEYWAEAMIPWVHYVPVADQGQDLFDIIRHLERNPALAETIGRQAQHYAVTNITLPGALHRIIDLINHAAAVQTRRG